MKKITINDFIKNPNRITVKIYETNTGHITNSAWMVLKSHMPMNFHNKIKSIIDDGVPNGQTILDDMAERKFYEVKLIDPKDLERDDITAIGYQCEKFQVFFTIEYILYLTKYIRKLKIMASAPDKPTKLITQDGAFGDVEFGILMPYRV